MIGGRSSSNSGNGFSAAAFVAIGASIFVILMAAILAVFFYKWKKLQIKKMYKSRRAGTAQMDIVEFSHETNGLED
jgi:hypothetical protein